MKKMLFVMNPISGQRKAHKFLPDILQLFNRAGYETLVYMTGKQGDAKEMVALRAKDVDLVVCAGGDGTFNEAVSGILSSGLDVPLGYIPCGSTNDFAASLGLPTNILKAAQEIVEGNPVRYDMGLFGSRYFSYVASFGAFTRASYATPQSVKNALGHMAYILGGISELSQIRKEKVRIELKDRVIEDEFLFGAVSNSTSMGGILTLDPKQVDMKDGKFELLLVRAPKNLAEIGECLQALQTQKYNCAMITFLSTDSLTVVANPDMPWTLDGEREDGHAHIEIQNLHQALRLMKKE
jgi:YegS/Rv2252/BmrU family lipid kinase